MRMTNLQPNLFSSTLLKWHRQHGRHNMPWKSKDPYVVWVSELMLQQTQVKTVLKYFPNFIKDFPSVQALAQANLDEVYQKWSGLGYYRRARFLHEGANLIMSEFAGKFPTESQHLLRLPGVGQSTANAILAFCYEQRVSIFDGNVQRVFSRWLGFSKDLSKAANKNQLWGLASEQVPPKKHDMPSYTQALMDFGATHCTPKSPSCQSCPFKKTCKSFADNTVNQTPSLPKKKLKTKTRHFNFTIHLKRDPLKETEIGFVRYEDRSLWKNLFGPPLEETEDLEKVTHTEKFSHFIGKFHVSISTNALNHPDNLIWKTKEEWQKMGLPSLVKNLLNNL